MDSSENTNPRLGKTRVGLAVLLCLPLIPAIVAATTLRFTGGRMLDESAFASYATSAIADPKVDDAVGQVVGDKVLDVIDENHQKPEKVRDAIKAAAATVISTDAARTIAVDIFTRTHDEFVAIAERDDLTGKETMAVDFTPLVYRAFQAVADADVVTFRSKLPAADTLTDNAAMLAALSKAVGHDLAAKAGSVRMVDQKEDGSDTAFVTVHNVLNAYHNGVNVATGVALFLVLGIVLLFPRRRVGTIVVSSVVLAATFLPWNALGQVPSKVADQIDNERGKAVASAFLDPLTGDVRSRLLVVSVLAVVGILVGSFWTRLSGLVGRKNAAA